MRRFLSYLLEPSTPTYGDRNRFEIAKGSAIAHGATANDSHISTNVHVGTHIDMPYHFYEKGQTIEAFDASFWVFEAPLFVTISPGEQVIKESLITALHPYEGRDYDMLIVKTGSCMMRGEERYWKRNYGFHPDLYDYLALHFPQVRVFGFDTISVSSFADRETGREAHRRFLNPERPLLLLEDMDLRNAETGTALRSVTVAPLRIGGCDGLPCTVIGEWDD